MYLDQNKSASHWIWAHLNEDSKEIQFGKKKILFGCDITKKNWFASDMGNSELLVQTFVKSKKHSMPLNARVKYSDESRRDLGHASARARQRKHTLAFVPPG